jgi:hypothetical protein
MARYPWQGKWSANWSVGCWVHENTEGHFGGSRKLAESEARRIGWGVRNGKWHCPDCLLPEGIECDGGDW